MRSFRLPKMRLPNLTPLLRRWATRLVLFTLLGVSIGLMVGFVRMTWTRHQINLQRERQIAINEVQAQRNAALKGETEYRESDVYAEQAAREQLGMARPGETVLLPTVVLPPTPTPAPAPSPTAPAVEQLFADSEEPNYQRWWQALFPADKAEP